MTCNNFKNKDNKIMLKNKKLTERGLMDKLDKKLETQKQVSAIDRLDNSSLKKSLLLARNISNKAVDCIGKLADDISNIITQYRAIIKDENVQELKDKKFDTEKSLREYCFNSAGYDRKDKNAINPAFEMIVTRSIKAGKLKADNKFGLTVKNGELLGINNKVNPTVPQKNMNKKIKKAYIDVENTDTSLIPINANTIDRIWKTVYPVNTRNNTNKKTVNISKTLKECKDILESLHRLAKNPKKQTDLYQKITDDDLGLIADIKLLVSDDVIRSQWNKADENIGMDLKPLKVSA